MISIAKTKNLMGPRVFQQHDLLYELLISCIKYFEESFGIACAQFSNASILVGMHFLEKRHLFFGRF